jgi:hypothetical protein
MLAARRMLWIEKEDGDFIGVPVDFTVPEDDRSAWCCEVRIGWPDGPEIHRICGLDAVHALELAMRFTGVQLRVSRYHREGSLYFEHPGDDYGFPDPEHPSR